MFARVAGLLSLLLASSLATAQPESVDAPPLKIGDAWQYRVVDGFNGVQLGTEGTRVLAESPRGYRLAFSQGGAVVERDATVELNLRQEVPGLPDDSGELRFPLSVGKTWKSSSWYESPEGGKGVFEIEHEVVGYRKIHVPAGDFDAFEIRGKGFWNLKVPPLRRTTDWSGRYERTAWYAPAVKRWVLVETRSFAGGHTGAWSRKELTSFQVN